MAAGTSTSYYYPGNGLQMIASGLSINTGIYGIGGMVNTSCVLKFFCLPGGVTPVVGSGISSGSISSITWASSIATVTTSAPHGLTINNVCLLTISNEVPSSYNGKFNCTVTSATQFTYPLTASPGAQTAAGSYLGSNNTLPVLKVPIHANTQIEEQYTEGLALTAMDSLWCCLTQYFDDTHQIRWSTQQYIYNSAFQPAAWSAYVNGGGIAPIGFPLSNSALLTWQNAHPGALYSNLPIGAGDMGDPVVMNYGANITIRYSP